MLWGLLMVSDAPARRSVFYVSDGTGITAESLGHSLLSQFEGVQWHEVRMPFIDDVEKAQACLLRIKAARQRDGARPIIVTTLVQEAVAAVIAQADGVVLNFFDTFIAPLELELQQPARHMVGGSRGGASSQSYMARIAAIDFAVSHDDGITDRGFAEADLILVGVSRSGKTPTSLYLALQFGIKAANYPLIPEDFERQSLPPALLPHRNKLYGLSIDPHRLNRIRQERRPDSRYAALDNCIAEVQAAERMMQHHDIAWLDTSSKSIEEIAATLVELLARGRGA